MRVFDQLYLSIDSDDKNISFSTRVQALSIGMQFQKRDFPIHRAILDGYFHELDFKDECLRAGLKNAMHDFDTTKQTPLMLAVRSGRYDNVQAMVDLSTIDFHVAGKPSAWDLALMIGDPEMLRIISEGRLRI